MRRLFRLNLIKRIEVYHKYSKRPNILGYLLIFKLMTLWILKEY